MAISERATTLIRRADEATTAEEFHEVYRDAKDENDAEEFAPVDRDAMAKAFNVAVARLAVI